MDHEAKNEAKNEAKHEGKNGNHPHRGHHRFGKRHENRPKHMPVIPTGSVSPEQAAADLPNVLKSFQEGEYAVTGVPIVHEYLEDGTENVTVNVERMK